MPRARVRNSRAQTRARRTGPITGVLLALTLPALAQQEQPEPVAIDQLPPEIKLGARAQIVGRSVPTAGTVVITPDEASYYAAIEAWSVRLRWPVLLDDGSREAAENIGRFVRAFGPDRVVTWSGNQPDIEPRGQVERAALGAWDTEPVEGQRANTTLASAWRGLGHTPPGLVVTSAAHPTRTAAAAIAAYRGLPLVWVEAPDSPNGRLTPEQTESLCAAIERAADTTGLGWRELGDNLDAVALCLNAPVAVLDPGDDKNRSALTDRVGRLGPESRAPRWAWAGQIIGDAQSSAYRAMCGLFLTPASAWLYDGYDESAPWNQYDATAASEFFEKAQMPVRTTDTPDQSIDDWRAVTTGRFDAGLVLINSSGNADFFSCKPGRGSPGDAPVQLVPTAVHMVHSWSARAPTSLSTVAGRWLAHGSYAYIGSVQEPYLQAFVPTPAVAARLLSSSAWGAAGRVPGGERWKIAVLGDPLMTITGPSRRVEEAPALEGTQNVDDLMRDAASKRDIAALVRTLVLLGRDEQLTRLAKSLFGGEEAVAPGVAELLILPLARQGEAPLVFAIYPNLDAENAADPLLRDALWHSAWRRLVAQQADESMLALLRANVRTRQEIDDAAMMAPAWKSAFGVRGAISMLTGIRDSIENPSHRKRAEKMVKKVSDQLRARPRGRGAKQP